MLAAGSQWCARQSRILDLALDDETQESLAHFSI
jgi:hypothetical protein